jgi:hypothetical protein
MGGAGSCVGARCDGTSSYHTRGYQDRIGRNQRTGADCLSGACGGTTRNHVGRAGDSYFFSALGVKARGKGRKNQTQSQLFHFSLSLHERFMKIRTSAQLCCWETLIGKRILLRRQA